MSDSNNNFGSAESDYDDTDGSASMDSSPEELSSDNESNGLTAFFQENAENSEDTTENDYTANLYSLIPFDKIFSAFNAIANQTSNIVLNLVSAVNVVAENISKFQPAITAVLNGFDKIVAGYAKVLENIAISPLIDFLCNTDSKFWETIAEKLKISVEASQQLKEARKICYATLMECKWFPYAASPNDYDLLFQIFEIMETSRGISKRCETRIDKAILTYYSDSRIKQIKKEWYHTDFPVYIRRILSQAMNAHLRGEYALTISSLATLWEGIIYIKANDTSMKYRQRQKMEITKANLATLTSKNNQDSIFSDYFNEFIVSQCDGPKDVKDGVPNRNGIAHSWYYKYPNKKTSLNAILITDYLLSLEPIKNIA